MTQEERDIILKDLSTLTKRLNQKMDELDKKLQEECKKLNDKIEETKYKLTKEIEQQRMNMAKMEYELGDKIDALFDARQISIENDEIQEQKFKSIENTLEKHQLRISILESKLS